MSKRITDVDRLSDKITQSVVANSFFSKVENDDTHMLKHVVNSDVQMLDRVLSDNVNKDRLNYNDKERKTINSGFASEDDAYTNIEECVLFKSRDIAEWAIDARNNVTNSFEVTLPAEDGYDPVGYGYIVDRKTNTIAEYQTNTIRLVLENNGIYNQSSNVLNFGILTSYPDLIRQENRTPTGNDISKLAKQTDTYKNASPVGKGYITYQTRNGEKPYLATFKKGDDGNVHDDVVSIQIPHKMKDGTERQTLIRIKENQMLLMLRAKDQTGRWQKIPSVYTRKFNDENARGYSVDLTRPEVMAEFKERNPLAAKIVSEIQDVVNPKVIDVQEKIAEKQEKLNEQYMPSSESQQDDSKFQIG